MKHEATKIVHKLKHSYSLQVPTLSLIFESQFSVVAPEFLSSRKTEFSAGSNIKRIVSEGSQMRRPVSEGSENKRASLYPVILSHHKIPVPIGLDAKVFLIHH